MTMCPHADEHHWVYLGPATAHGPFYDKGDHIRQCRQCFVMLALPADVAEKSSPYEQRLFQRLRDPDEAVMYLKNFLSNTDDSDHKRLLLLALRDIAAAYDVSLDA